MCHILPNSSNSRTQQRDLSAGRTHDQLIMRSGLLQRRRSYDSDRMIMGSTRILVTFLEKTIYDHHICLVVSIKQQIYVDYVEVKREPENLENGRLLSGSGFVQWMAPPSLPCDTKIKIYQSIINHDLSRKSSVLSNHFACV